MARVLVIGGAGFVGAHVVECLAERGHSPVVYDNARRLSLHEGVHPVEGGGLDDAAVLLDVLERHGIEAAICCIPAAEGASRYSAAEIRNRAAARAMTVMSAILKAGVTKLVFGSTAHVYGAPGYVPVDESHPLSPATAAANAKLAGEKIIQTLAEAYPLDYGILRYYAVAGADEDLYPVWSARQAPCVISRVLRQAAGLSAGPLELRTGYDTADGTLVRDIIHVRDLAAAHVEAADVLLNGAPSLVCNLGSPSGYSLREVISTVEQVTARPVPVLETKGADDKPPILTLDTRLAGERLGYVPKRTGLDRIVEETARLCSAHWSVDLMSRAV